MLVMFFFLFFSFFSPRVLGVPSTDRPETLPPDPNLRVFYNASPKIRGHSPQKIIKSYLKVIAVHIDPPKWTYFETQYFGT